MDHGYIEIVNAAENSLHEHERVLLTQVRDVDVDS
jgi:hypothetical protein